MSGLFKQYATDNTKQVEGVEVELVEAENEDGSIPVFVISRMGKGNKAYSKALEAATRPFRRQVELGTMKNEVAEELMLDVFINTVLKGWRNVQDKDGNELQFNKANAKELLGNPELVDLYERLQEEARIASNFRQTKVEEEAKN